MADIRHPSDQVEAKPPRVLLGLEKFSVVAVVLTFVGAFADSFHTNRQSVFLENIPRIHERHGTYFCKLVAT